LWWDLEEKDLSTFSVLAIAYGAWFEFSTEIQVVKVFEIITSGFLYLEFVPLGFLKPLYGFVSLWFHEDQSLWCKSRDGVLGRFQLSCGDRSKLVHVR
jgi:hypothetical protein